MGLVTRRRQLVGIAGFLAPWIASAKGTDAPGAAGSAGYPAQKNTTAPYPQTAAEIAANAPVVNFDMPPGWVTRYGTNTIPATTDMTAAIQAACNQAGQTSAPGAAEVYFPPSIYAISSPISLARGITLKGASKKLYPNFTNDWQTLTPSWGLEASTIQYQRGRHGPIFSGGAYCDISGLVFRSGQVSTASDCLWAAGTAISHMRMNHCCIQNLNHIAQCASAPFGAWDFYGNQVTGCGGGFAGAIVDMIIRSNSFTSLSSEAFAFMPGSADSLIVANRFEFSRLYSISVRGAGSGRHVINGNVFDHHDTAAIFLNNADGAQSITSNFVNRNGAKNDSVLLHACHIYLFKTGGHLIADNLFVAAGPDGGGGTATPKHVIGLDSCQATQPSRFSGNSTRNGCTTSSVFQDRDGTSLNAVEAVGSIDLPGGADPGTPTDDFISALRTIDRVCNGSSCVHIFEPRCVTDSGICKKVSLHGVGAVAPTLTNSHGAAGFASIDNINYGNLIYSVRRGDQYAPSPPDALHTNGVWSIGDVIYNPHPVAGGSAGWVLVAANGSGTWKTWGSVGA